MYQIIIKKIEDKDYTHQEWKQLSCTNGQSLYGYAPEITSTRQEETEIYRQTSDKDIDIKSIIDAFNQ